MDHDQIITELSKNDTRWRYIEDRLKVLFDKLEGGHGVKGFVERFASMEECVCKLEEGFTGGDKKDSIPDRMAAMEGRMTQAEKAVKQIKEDAQEHEEKIFAWFQRTWISIAVLFLLALGVRAVDILTGVKLFSLG